MAQPLISIVIVNYNSGDWLRRCLSYVEQQTYPHWEVIIVDNASQDDSLALVRQSDRVRIIRNQENRGFAAGQNQGIRMAHGDFVMPLNFDIRMTRSFLDMMLLGIQSDVRVGSVCGKLRLMDKQWRPTRILDSTGMIMLPSAVPYSRGAGEFDLGQYDNLPEVFGALGAAPLYRREMLDDIAFEGQYFDEHFFMWYEDADLDWRAHLRGWKSRYIPEALAHHVGHPESRRDAFHVATTIRNRWFMLLTNATNRDVHRHIKSIIAHEFSLWWYVVRSGLLDAYFHALGSLASSQSYLRRKRVWVQSRKITEGWAV